MKAQTSNRWCLKQSGQFVKLGKNPPDFALIDDIDEADIFHVSSTAFAIAKEFGFKMVNFDEAKALIAT